MKNKNKNSAPIALFVAAMIFFTAAAGALALLVKSDDKPSVREPEKKPDGESAPVITDSVEEEEPSFPLDFPEAELRKTADTYGQTFGVLVNEGQGEISSDLYCADQLYRVTYENGTVDINGSTKELYWICRTDVRAQETRLTERDIIKKAKEYLASLQLNQSYGHTARKLNRETNAATVIFQRVIDEENDLYSDFEAVKMTLSMQTGEVITCKVFDLPLVEQAGEKITENQAVLAAAGENPEIFSQYQGKAELIVSSPLVWGEKDNYTSRIVWKVTAGESIFYVDAYSDAVLGRILPEGNPAS